MAALSNIRTTLRSLGARRLWAAIGESEDEGYLLVADSLSIDQNASPPSIGDARTFRRLDSDTEDLLDRNAFGCGAVSPADGTVRALGSFVKPIAGWVASIVAAAATMTLLFPPKEADAYTYHSNGGHYDHAQKLEIQLVPSGSLDGIWYNAYAQAARAWSQGTTEVIVNFSPFAETNSKMVMYATAYEDPNSNYYGTATRWTPDANKHWIHKPATILWLNKRTISWSGTLAGDFAMLIASHEAGHALGLAHPWETNDVTCYSSEVNNGIMQRNGHGVYWECGWRDPQRDDLTGVDALYGAGSAQK